MSQAVGVSRNISLKVRAVTWDYKDAPRQPGEPHKDRKPIGLVFHLECGHEVQRPDVTMGTWTAEQTVKKLECRFRCGPDTNPNKESDE